MKLIEILPKIPQWESIPYNPWLDCDCGEAGFGSNKEKLKLVGWCDTDFGYMGVFECPCCFAKLRFHMASDRFRFELPALERGLRCYMGLVSNEEELRRKIGEDDE